MANIFDTVKRVQTTKEAWKDIPDEERKVFNPWMFQKVLSMNPDYCELVNIIQKNTWQLKHEFVYTIYNSIIPEGYKFSKYIKCTTKNSYLEDEVLAVAKYYEVSTKQAKKYIDILEQEEITRIKNQIQI